MITLDNCLHERAKPGSIIGLPVSSDKNLTVSEFYGSSRSKNEFKEECPVIANCKVDSYDFSSTVKTIGNCSCASKNPLYFSGDEKLNEGSELDSEVFSENKEVFPPNSLEQFVCHIPPSNLKKTNAGQGMFSCCQFDSIKNSEAIRLLSLLWEVFSNIDYNKTGYVYLNDLYYLLEYNRRVQDIFLIERKKDKDYECGFFSNLIRVVLNLNLKPELTDAGKLKLYSIKFKARQLCKLLSRKGGNNPTLISFEEFCHFFANQIYYVDYNGGSNVPSTAKIFMPMPEFSRIVVKEAFLGTRTINEETKLPGNVNAGNCLLVEPQVPAESICNSMDAFKFLFGGFKNNIDFKTKIKELEDLNQSIKGHYEKVFE